MNDFKGFVWRDPGLRARIQQERQARTAGSDLPTGAGVPTGSALPTGPDLPETDDFLARGAMPAKFPRQAGSTLPIGAAGMTPPTVEDNDWQHLAPPPPEPAPPPLAQPSMVSQAPPPQRTPGEPAAAFQASAVPAPNARASVSQAPVPRATGPQAPVSPLRVSTAPQPAQQSTFQRAVNVFRSAMPLVQRVLPLLDGNVGSAVSNLMAPRPQFHPPQPPTNLVPLENGLARLQLQHRELRDTIVEQNASLKKVEDQLDQVREATDRNTLEQQELLQDLKSVGTKVNIFAYVGLALLGLSVVLNVVLFVELRHFVR
jgi:hypothetical protein